MEQRSYKVYKHTFPNRKVYIGITRTSPTYRWKNGYAYKEQPLIYRAIQKYGWENIKHEILFDELTQEEACNKEIELIKEYNSTNSKYGYNLSAGGFTHSEKSKKKMSKLKKNYVPWNKGKQTGHLSSEHREKIRNEHLGKYTGAKNPMARKVINLTTGEVFDCIKLASEKYNIHSTHISACCRGKVKTCRKCEWKYFEEVS